MAVFVAAALSACSGGSATESTDTTGRSPGSTVANTSSVPVGRVVALGEERVLADLLALGIKPVASTADAIVDGGFHGLEDFDTDGIRPLPATEPNLELLASLEADVIVANEFVTDYIGRDVLERMAKLVVVPDGDAATQVRALGKAFGRTAEAEALVDQLDKAIEQGREALASVPKDERIVSVLTVYSGRAIAAWVDGPVDTPATLLDLGYTLRPDTDALAGVPGGRTDGRAYISEEQIGMFDAPTIVAMQTNLVDGEDEALADVEGDALWKALPAVRSGRVVTVDRLGYPGIAGRIRLVGDLVEQLR